MIDNIDRLLTRLANHDSEADTIRDNLANGTVRRTRISEWTLPLSLIHISEPTRPY